VGFVKAATDRSAAHHAAEALASISERYRMAASATNDAIWDHDLVSNAVLWNEALETAYGWPPAVVEPTGRWWMAQIHPEDRARVERGLQAVIEGGGTGWTEEYRFRRFDGGHAHVLDRGYVIRDAGGRPLRMIGAMLDLTERRRAEAALRESADRLRLATAAARIGTFDADFAAGALTWDDRCRELFGLPPGAPVSYAGSFLAGLHPEDRAAADAAVQRAMDPAGSGQFDVEYRTVGLADGVERWVAAQGEAIADEAGRPVRLIGTVRDIGDRKRLEQQQQQLAGRLEQLVEARTAALRRSEAQLLQSQKMEAVGQLTGGIAHDFNNLLTGITGSLELLERRLEQGRLQGLERYVGMAQGAARRAAALTHRLLAFSRQQTLDPRPTDANRLVAGIEEMIRRSIGPAIELRVAEGAALWPTLVDPNQLENALLNLCINARDAMPEGGRLTLATANVWLAEGHALTGEHGLPPGAYVAVSVADTGTGMTPEVMARAFDPFFTTKPLGQGTGLGLSMIYGFASQSGGLARIASEPGRGSTVTLYLPRHDGAAGSALETAGGTPPGGVLRSPGAAAAAWPAATGRSVLVVDDEATLRLLVTDLLTELGHRPLEAGDAAGGLALLHSDLPVDLLVADIGLPGGMNGRQMAELARAHRPGLKVLFITGYADGAGLEAALAEPGTQLLTKPFGLEALAARVGEMLAEA
jgi:PAS domain S-box-containing protein